VGPAVNDTDVISSRLVSVRPRLGRWGSRGKQHPQAPRQPNEQEHALALIAACHLLDLAPLPGHFEPESVAVLARGLLDNISMSLDNPAGTLGDASDGTVAHNPPRRTRLAGDGDGKAVGPAGPF